MDLFGLDRAKYRLPGVHRRSAKLRHNPERRLPPRNTLYVVERVAEARNMIVPCRSGEVRGQHDVIELEQGTVRRRRLLVEHVKSGTEDASRGQRLVQGNLV